MKRLGTAGRRGRPALGVAAAVAAAGLLVAGCSGTSTTASAGVPGTASASAGSSAAAAVTAISVSIAGGTVTPAPGRIDVAKGSTVKLTVTSDVADEVHVHGIDKEFEISPGQPGSITFTVTDPGVYEVETHKSGKTLFQLVVR